MILIHPMWEGQPWWPPIRRAIRSINLPLAAESLMKPIVTAARIVGLWMMNYFDDNLWCMNNKSGLATDNSDEVLEFAQRIMPMLGLLYNDKCSENGAPIWDPIHSVTLTVDAGAVGYGGHTERSNHSGQYRLTSQPNHRHTENCMD